MVNVHENSWHYKLYLKAVDLWFDFKGDKESHYDYEKGAYVKERNVLKAQSNLCFYMRVILVWAPVVYLSQVALAAFAAYTLIVLPIALAGLTATYLATATVILGCSVVLFVLFGISYVYEAWRWRDRDTKVDNFFSLCIEFIKAKKKKICPTINIIRET